MNVKPKKTPEEMRAYKLSWYHSHKKPISGVRKNQNTDKTSCVHGHELSGDNLRMKGTHRTCRECHRANQRRISKEGHANKDPRSPFQIRRRKAQLKRVGWTPEKFDVEFEKQGKACAVCKKPLALYVGQQESRACADHKHVYPPEPRGILCPQCNLGIGNLQDNPEILEAAAKYLRKY